jgi:hypothetical protein
MLTKDLGEPEKVLMYVKMKDNSEYIKMNEWINKWIN